MTNCTDDAARKQTAPARAVFAASFEIIVDPGEKLDPEERARRAAEAKRAHMAKLGRKSGRVRRLRRIAELDAELQERIQAARESCDHLWPADPGPDTECLYCDLTWSAFPAPRGVA